MEDKTSLYRQNFELRKENAELKRLSYTLSKANDRIKYLEKKLENIEEKHQKEIDAIIVKTVEQVTAKLEKEHQKEIAVLNKKIAKLDYFKDDEIDETIEYTLDKYPKCGGMLISNLYSLKININFKINLMIILTTY